MPAFKNIMMRAGQAKCSSNMRQVGLGLLQYASDFGELPYYQGSARWFDGSTAPKSFFAGPYLGAAACDPYYKTGPSSVGGILDCPSRVSANLPGFDYAYNISLTGRRLSSFSQPSRTVLATEGGDDARVKAQGGGSPSYYSSGGSANPGGTAWNGPNLPIAYPHNGVGNFLFIDGHIGVFKQSDLSEKWFDGKWDQ